MSNARNIASGAKFVDAAGDSMTGNLGIGVAAPSDDFEIKPSADEKGITLKTPDSIRPYLNFDANRSGANQQVMRLQGKWNGNTITRFETSTGDDTSNKDNGYFTFQTATSSSDLNTRVRIDEHGIKFGSDTAEANGLHDYEEGTWTPVIGGSTSTSGQSYSVQAGTYTKIGNTVNAHAYISLNSVGTVSGTYAYIMGFPFNVTNSNGAYPAFPIGYFAGLGQNVSSLGGYLNKNTTTAYVTFRQGAGTSIQYLSAGGIGNSAVIFSITYNTAA